MYAANTATGCHRAVSAATPSAISGNTVPINLAVVMPTAPDATGRFDLVGWARSASTSSTSFQK